LQIHELGWVLVWVGQQDAIGCHQEVVVSCLRRGFVDGGFAVLSAALGDHKQIVWGHVSGDRLP
jgi:hypothetical protein